MESTVTIKTPRVEITITDKPGEPICIQGHAPDPEELVEAINKALSFKRYPVQVEDPLKDLDDQPF